MQYAFISHTIGPADLPHPSPKPHLKTFPGISGLLSEAVKATAFFTWIPPYDIL
jgi:hypothetical protein